MNEKIKNLDKYEDLTFQDAKNFLVYKEKKSKIFLKQLNDFFEERLKNSKDREKKIENLFYLILVKLRTHSIETHQVKKYFFELHSLIISLLFEKFGKSASIFFSKIPIKFLKNFDFEVDINLKILSSRVKINEIKSFIYICSYYIQELERNYKNIGMSERVTDLYILKMDIRKHEHFINKNFKGFIGLIIFKFISGYGTSLIRLSCTCFVSVVFFAGMYWIADYFSPPNIRMIKDLGDYSNYFFNSLVTITGLGIDASPMNGFQRLAMGINTIYGMIVFGLLFNVISTKLSMNE